MADVRIVHQSTVLDVTAPEPMDDEQVLAAVADQLGDAAGTAVVSAVWPESDGEGLETSSVEQVDRWLVLRPDWGWDEFQGRDEALAALDGGTMRDLGLGATLIHVDRMEKIVPATGTTTWHHEVRTTTETETR